MRETPQIDPNQTPPQRGVFVDIEAPEGVVLLSPIITHGKIIIESSIPDGLFLKVRFAHGASPHELIIKGNVGKNVRIVTPYPIEIIGDVGDASFIHSTWRGDVCISGGVGENATVIAERGKVRASCAQKNAHIIARAGECIVHQCKPGAKIESNVPIFAKRTLFVSERPKSSKSDLSVSMMDTTGNESYQTDDCSQEFSFGDPN